MVFLATEHIDIPNQDLISWYFDSPRCDPDKPIYIDALEPSRYYTHQQAKTTIQQLCAGFRAAGLQKGDTVCVHSFNDVSKSCTIFLGTII
jgi:non-ribosomal peptide synthetase component E (peptide arylation enzyme)